MITCALTALFGYPRTVLIMAALAGVTLLTELIWTQVVYGKFPILKIDEERRKKLRVEYLLNEAARNNEENSGSWLPGLKDEWADWKGFASMPVFWRESWR